MADDELNRSLLPRLPALFLVEAEETEKKPAAPVQQEEQRVVHVKQQEIQPAKPKTTVPKRGTKLVDAILNQEKGGVFRKEYTVECATCAYYEPFYLDKLAMAENAAREKGWALSKEFGWLCSSCSRKKRSNLTLWTPTGAMERIRRV